MAVYLIAHVKVTDDAWLPDYAANVHDIVHKHGGTYAKYREARQAGSISRFHVIDDTDVAGTIPYLPPG